MNKKKYIRDYSVMTVGSLVIGLGVGFVVYAGLGADAMTTFENGLYVTFHIALSLAALLANLLFLLLLMLVERSRVSLETIFSPLLISLGVQVFSAFIPSPSSLLFRVVYMATGLILVGLGIGIGAQSETGSNPYDGFVLAISGRIHKEYRLLRPCIDACMLLLGIAMKGSFGVGTIIMIVFQGYIAQFFMKLLKGKF